MQLVWGNTELHELAVLETLLNPSVTSVGLLKRLDGCFISGPPFENPLTLLARQTGEGRDSPTAASAKHIFIILLGIATVPLQLVDPVTKLETSFHFG